MEKQNLTEYSENELSLVVMNDEYLYNMRHRSCLKETLDDFFEYTPEQMEVLMEDIESEEE